MKVFDAVLLYNELGDKNKGKQYSKHKTKIRKTQNKHKHNQSLQTVSYMPQQGYRIYAENLGIHCRV